MNPIHSLPLLILTVDTRLHILHAAGAVEALGGIRPAELAGQPLEPIIALPAPVAAHLHDCLSLGTSLKAYDQTITLCGKARMAHVYLNPCWPENGDTATPQGLVLALDILEGRMLAGELWQQRETTRQVALMAAMLAHEIKNPLASIRSAAQLLGMESGNPEMSMLIVRESDRISGILERVEFLRLTEGMPKQPVNVHEALHYACSVLPPTLRGRITFDESFDPTLPEIEGVQDALVQLFLNLLKNAAEALSHTENPVITLSSRMTRQAALRTEGKRRLSLEVLIEDNGPGLPDAVRENLFSAFVTGRRGGTGLGLMIAAGIAAAHEGLLELVESRSGHTCFRILLPVARPSCQSGDHMLS